MWQILVLLYFIFATASYLLRRVLAQKIGEHNRVINSVFFLFFLLPAAVILGIFFPHNLNVGLVNLLLLLGGSAIWPILAINSFHANKKVDVGIFTIISNLSPIFTLMVALPFMNEHLSLMQFVGIGLLIFSGIIVTFPQVKKRSLGNTSGILFSILSAVILGLAVAYESFMLKRVDFGTYLILGWGSQIAWSLIFSGRDLKKIPKLLGKGAETRKVLLLWGSTGVIQSILFISALKISGSASLFSAATDFMSVAVVIAAYFFLKEHKHIIYKILGAIIGITGLLLIAG